MQKTYSGNPTPITHSEEILSDLPMQDEESPMPMENSDIQTNFTPLSSYSTPILSTSENRYHNIQIVADKLNGYLLGPGETFSYNQVCGPYGEEEGFLEATVLLSDGTESTDFGGGVCQLSSTLYNAVKDLNIQITERHHHSSPVPYVPENEDATVSMESGLDFQFINQNDFALRFETAYDPNNLTVNVFQNS